MKSSLRCAAAVTAAAVTFGIVGCSPIDSSVSVPDDWHPQGSVKVVVAFAAGGGSDRSARVVSQAINERNEGFTLNVENVEGGSGAVGWSTFMSEQGKGDALLIAESALNILPVVYDDVEFEYNSFTPIALFAEDTRMIVAPADSPYDDCNELAEAGLKDRVVSGSSGQYGPDAMARAAIQEETQADFSVVPYGSSGEVVTGLLSGDVDFAPMSASTAKPQIEAGELKGLCVLSEERFDDPVVGSVPTAIEQGIDATVVQWRGLLAPADIADVQREYWIKQAREATASPTFEEYIDQDLLISKQLYGDDFARYLDDYQQQVEGVFGD